ncbi:hypothetical protein [Arthrobacter sp. 9AX]|uniref:hypothetical protein n=1 Tax=Arthrobacter sp. 9AX TaxID=2653131 RepID=UPI00135A7237|nr:hypothetical protein [Arthrobacter sp. 9AX]
MPPGSAPPETAAETAGALPPRALHRIITTPANIKPTRTGTGTNATGISATGNGCRNGRRPPTKGSQKRSHSSINRSLRLHHRIRSHTHIIAGGYDTPRCGPSSSGRGKWHSGTANRFHRRIRSHTHIIPGG